MVIGVAAACAGTAFDGFVAALMEALAGKSPRTQSTYATGLRRYRDFLVAGDRLAAWEPASLTGTALEEFYGWLVRRHGRDHWATITSYLAGARALVRFLARRALLAPTVTYEQMRENARAVIPRATYRTPRIDQRLPALVVAVRNLPVPPASRRRGTARLTLLRDKALLSVLFCTGMRRDEIARLDRADVGDGWASQALITGKGGKERVVFFDAETLQAIRDYFDARADELAPVFLRHDFRRSDTPGPGGRHWRFQGKGIWCMVKRYGRLTGVLATPHGFRHIKASTLLNRGASLSEVQDLLGHASPETTKRIYAHYKVQHLREAFDRYSASAEELVAELRPT